MDLLSAKWLSEFDMDDEDFISQYHINSMDGGLGGHNIAAALEERLQESLSSDSHSSYNKINPSTNTTVTSFGGSSPESSQTSLERPVKLLKTNSWDSAVSDLVSPKPSSSSSCVLSFQNSNLLPATSQQIHGGLLCGVMPKPESVLPGYINFPPVVSKGSPQSQNGGQRANQGTKRTYSLTRTPSHAQDHIMAERKRREKLSQRFIALSAIVPGLKKMDKASVLGEAIKYVKQLQERVQLLEEQTKKRTVESVVLVKKSQVAADDDSSSCDENFDGNSGEAALPEIEARISEKNVLIRIHCENHKGFVAKIQKEIEKFHLFIVSSCVLPFGNSTLDITIIAQMEDEFNMKVKDLAIDLRTAIMKFYVTDTLPQVQLLH